MQLAITKTAVVPGVDISKIPQLTPLAHFHMQEMFREKS